MSDNPVSYHSPLPYPPIQVASRNRYYAKEMLDNVGGVGSEMSAVCRYVYNNMVTTEYEEIHKTFKEISIVEMHHLQIFGDLSLQLGETPRMWTQRGNRKVYWSPQYVDYPGNLKKMFHSALEGELRAIDKYKSQCRRIEDPNIIENLSRIIIDEELHVEIFRETLMKI